MEFPVDFLWNLMQQLQIWDQETQAESLEERVQVLEKELGSTRQALMSLLLELHRRSAKDGSPEGLSDTLSAITAELARVPSETHFRPEVAPESPADSPPDRPANLPDDCCLSCGALMPEGTTVCAACGWTYDAHEETDEEKPPA